MSRIVILIILLGIIVAIYVYQQYINDSDESEDIDAPQNIRYINNKNINKIAYIEKDDESDISGLDSWDPSLESKSEDNFDDFSLSNMSENDTDNKSNGSSSTFSL